MTSAESHDPTHSQLMAMAYVDGELAGHARLEFEERRRRDPALRREVVELRILVLLVRQIIGEEAAPSAKAS